MAKKRKLLESHPQWQPKNNRNNDFSVEVTIPISKPQKNVRIFNNDGTITYTTEEEALAKGYEVIQTQDGGYTAQKPFDTSSYNGQPIAEIPPQATIGPITEDRRSWTQKLLDATDLADRAGDGTLAGNIASNLYAFDQERSPINGLYNTFGLAGLASAGGFLKIPNIVHKVGIGLGIGLPLTLALTSSKGPRYITDDIPEDSLYKNFPEFKTLKAGELTDIMLNYNQALSPEDLNSALLRTIGNGSLDYIFNKASGKFERKDADEMNWWDYTWRGGVNLATAATDLYIYYMLKNGNAPSFSNFKSILAGLGFLGMNALGFITPWVGMRETSNDEIDKQLQNLYNNAALEYNRRVALERLEKAKQVVGKVNESIEPLVIPDSVSKTTSETPQLTDTTNYSNYIKGAIREQ